MVPARDVASNLKGGKNIAHSLVWLIIKLVVGWLVKYLDHPNGVLFPISYETISWRIVEINVASVGGRKFIH